LLAACLDNNKMF